MTNSTRDQIAKTKAKYNLDFEYYTHNSIKTIEREPIKSSHIRKGTVNKKSALQRY
jgi:hypothetical protein